MLALTGCGSDGGGGGEVVPGPSISPILDTDRESSASLGPEGGTVTATAADGTEYALSIPADALIDETEIVLTPIISVDDLPMSGGFIAGVHFEPSGLELFRTATLSVTQPAAPSLAADEALAGFVYDGAGENLGLALTEATGSSFTVPVNHFSGGGGGAANPNQLAAASTPGSANAFTASLLNAIVASDAQDAESILREWYQALVKPRLQAAVSNDAALERALDEYRRWLNAEGQVPLPIDVAALVSESQGLAADAFRAAIARANDLCERNASFEEAERALLWQRRAESVLPVDVLLQNNLDRSAVLADLCVQVVIESTSFPQSPVAGEPALLEVVFGFAFGDGPTELSTGMVAFILATGAAPAGATEFTDVNGRVALTLTPDGGSVTIEVDACIGNGGFNSGQLVAGLCQRVFIVRGLVVSPQEVVLDPGATQQFNAQLLGIDEPVTWSATGGNVDENGLYMAGTAPGTFTVTATSIADPSLVGTAEVTIEEDTIPNPSPAASSGRRSASTSTRSASERPSGVAVFQTGNQLEIHFPRVDLDDGGPPPAHTLRLRRPRVHGHLEWQFVRRDDRRLPPRPLRNQRHPQRQHDLRPSRLAGRLRMLHQLRSRPSTRAASSSRAGRTRSACPARSSGGRRLHRRRGGVTDRPAVLFHSIGDRYELPDRILVRIPSLGGRRGRSSLRREDHRVVRARRRRAATAIRIGARHRDRKCNLGCRARQARLASHWDRHRRQGALPRARTRIDGGGRHELRSG